MGATPRVLTSDFWFWCPLPVIIEESACPARAPLTPRYVPRCARAQV